MKTPTTNNEPTSPRPTSNLHRLRAGFGWIRRSRESGLLRLIEEGVRLNKEREEREERERVAAAAAAAETTHRRLPDWEPDAKD